MKILLVNPPRVNGIPIIREERCEIIERNSIIPPYSLLQIGKILIELKHDVTLIDANGENLRFKDIKLDGYNILIFRFTPTTFDHDLKITNRFRKKNPEGIIIGICFTLKTLWKEIMKEADLDIFITGDYEVVIKDLFTNFQNYSNIKGIAYKKNKKIFHNEYIRNGFDYDSLGIPAYNLLKNFNFYKINANTNEIFSIIYTSKGCPYKCNFCNVANTHLKTKSVDLVINEIKVLKDYGVQLISFFDETFTLDRKRVLEICNSLKYLNIKWYCNTRVNLIDYELLNEMKRAGCAGISFGCESGSQKILDICNKGINLKDIEKAINFCKIIGIKTYCAFIFGLPGENKNTANETIKFVKKLKPNSAQFNIAVPYPGTKLYEKYSRDINWKKLYQDEALISLCELSIKELNKIRKKAYRNLYFNPFWLYNNLLFIIKNPYETKLGINYFLKIMKNYFFYRMEKAH